MGVIENHAHIVRGTKFIEAPEFDRHLRRHEEPLEPAPIALCGFNDEPGLANSSVTFKYDVADLLLQQAQKPLELGLSPNELAHSRPCRRRRLTNAPRSRKVGCS